MISEAGYWISSFGLGSPSKVLYLSVGIWWDPCVQKKMCAEVVNPCLADLRFRGDYWSWLCVHGRWWGTMHMYNLMCMISEAGSKIDVVLRSSHIVMWLTRQLGIWWDPSFEKICVPKVLTLALTDERFWGENWGWFVYIEGDGVICGWHKCKVQLIDFFERIAFR